MTDPQSFAKLVPGFDFLQDLVKNAGAAMPAIGQWVAPTLNPEEIDKRIQELRTVQFWLEQNARMLGATIQALEVQKMTLSTLQTMNVQMEDLRESLTIRPMGTGTGKPTPGAAASASAPDPKARPDAAKEAGAPAAAPAAGPVDPMQWWSALTQQFTNLAANAMKDGAGDAAKNFTEAMGQAAASAAAHGVQPAGEPAKPGKPSGSSTPRKKTERE